MLSSMKIIILKLLQCVRIQLRLTFPQYINVEVRKVWNVCIVFYLLKDTTSFHNALSVNVKILPFIILFSCIFAEGLILKSIYEFYVAYS